MDANVGEHLVVAQQTLEIRRIGARRAGPTLVLLHEGLGCVAMWKRFPDDLAAATGLAVLVYSRAGYGGSSSVALPRALDTHEREALDVLPELLTRAGITDCILIGHSDGASIALIFAAHTHNVRVHGLTLMAPHVLTEQKCVANIRAAVAAFAAGGLAERLRRYHAANLEVAFRGWSEMWLDPAFSRWNIEHYLARIAVPVLVLRGVDDPYNTAVHVRSIAKHVRGEVTNIALPACGHAPHVEQPARVIAEIDQFVRRLAACV